MIKDLLILVLLLTFVLTTELFSLWPPDKYLLRIMIRQEYTSLQRFCRSEQSKGEKSVGKVAQPELPKVIA